MQIDFKGQGYDTDTEVRFNNTEIDCLCQTEF